jgi:NADH-quinone oxidoreductase subunit E
MLSEATRTQITQLMDRYPHRRSALLPALYLAQEEQGYVSEEAMAEVGDLLHLTAADVQSVASYYTMFFKQPVGRHILDVCTNLACKARGGEALLEQVCRRLQVSEGETTADGRFLVEEVECLGQCEKAPMLEVDLEVFGPINSAEELEGVLQRFS